MESQPLQVSVIRPSVEGKKLGEILTEMKFARNTEIKNVLREQTRIEQLGQSKFKLGQLLLFAKIIDENQLFTALRLQRASTKNPARSKAPASVSATHIVSENSQSGKGAESNGIVRELLRRHFSKSPVLNWFRNLYGLN